VLGRTAAPRTSAAPQLSPYRVPGDGRPTRVAFATASPEYLGFDDTDRPHHEAAAAAAGIELDHLVWSDPDAAWDRYDLVVVRSTWDYLDHLEDYLAWLAAMDGLGTLHNPGRVIAWNLDKSYLLELSAAGVPVIPTRLCAEHADVTDALDGRTGEVVVKPAVSAGSKLTGRFAPDDEAAGVLAGRILATGTAVLVQPAVASVAERGEVSTLVFGGSVSHTVRKGPLLALGGGLLGGTYVERIAPEVLTPGGRDLVVRAVDAVDRLVARRFGTTQPLLYARIDVVTLDDGTDVVLEVELAEPSFFLGADLDAARRFAAEVVRRAAVARA
jgi:glutathione synthase/RimK-type ligase-like ATP-grasp enzyme